MRLLFGVARVVAVLATIWALCGTATLAESAAPAVTPPQAAAAPPAGPADAAVDPTAWQAVIVGQIEAFRTGDSKAALSFAGAVFQKAFADPDTFMMSIAASGYTPIFTSISQSFGKFSQPDPDSVVQVVNLVGPKQELYEAIYVLGRENGEWRVQGVELAKTGGVAI